VSNVRQIAVAFQNYAAGNAGRLPDPLAADASWESVIAKHAGSDAVFRCPADEELAAAAGSSYDWRDTGDPATTLAGRLLADAPGSAVLVYDALPNWHAHGMMNAARVNGSAGPMDARACIADLMTPIRSTTRPSK
jgi:hypothetical protein